MKIFFGFVFLAMSAVLAATQAYIFPHYSNFDWWRSLLLAALTIGCIFGATLILNEPKESILRKIAAGGSSATCLGMIARVAFLLLTGGGKTSGWEYFILAIYTLSFGIYSFNGFES
jgi:hypothetical protein